MSSKRVVFSCAVTAVIVAAGSRYAVDAFPLTQVTAPSQAIAREMLRLQPPRQLSAPAQTAINEPGPLERTAKPITPENPIPRRVYAVMPVYPNVAPQDALLLPPTDYPREEGAHPPQDAPELDGEPRIGIERLDHERDDEAPMVRDRGVEEAGVDDAAKVRDRIPGGRDLLEHVPLEALNAIPHRLEEQLLLVPKVVVDRTLRDPGGTRDAVDRRALVAEPRKAIDRGARELLLRGRPLVPPQSRLGR